jgi:hypothetical protein
VRRHTDQDVAALYCAIRDVLAREEDERSLWRRIADAFRPRSRRAHRESLVAACYAEWQAKRPLPRLPEPEPLDHKATSMALSMVKAQRRGEHYATPKRVEVFDSGRRD